MVALLKSRMVILRRLSSTPPATGVATPGHKPATVTQGLHPANNIYCIVRAKPSQILTFQLVCARL